MSNTSITAALDTNVFLDIYSLHDLKSAHDDAHAIVGNAAIDEEPVVYRRARARESLLLAIYLDKIGATTHSLGGEAIDMLLRGAPPAPGGATMESDFTTIFIHCVKDKVLPTWDPHLMPAETDWEKALSAIPPALLVNGTTELEKPTGNNADAWHIAHAKRLGVPLITNEGFKPTGYGYGKIAKRAIAEGVQVLFPSQFYGGKMDEAQAIEDFVRRFREAGEEYIRERMVDDRMPEVLTWIDGYFRHVLLGATEGRDEPARVTV